MQLPPETNAPVTRGDVLGQIVYTLDGKTVGSVDIIAAEDVRKADYMDYLLQMLLMWVDVL